MPVTDLEADAEPVQLLGNLTAEGQPGQLRDWARRSGLDRIGPRLARGMAVADYDDDGDLDVAINQIGGPMLLLRNDDPPGRSVTVAAQPPRPGTRIEVVLANGTVIRRELAAGSSYLATEDPRLHVGLGTDEATSIRVIWPDGATAHIDGPISGPVDAIHPDS